MARAVGVDTSRVSVALAHPLHANAKTNATALEYGISVFSLAPAHSNEGCVHLRFNSGAVIGKSQSSVQSVVPVPDPEALADKKITSVE